MKTIKQFKKGKFNYQVWYVKKGEYNYLINSKSFYDSGIISANNIKEAIIKVLKIKI